MPTSLAVIRLALPANEWREQNLDEQQPPAYHVQYVSDDPASLLCATNLTQQECLQVATHEGKTLVVDPEDSGVLVANRPKGCVYDADHADHFFYFDDGGTSWCASPPPVLQCR